MSDLGRRLAGEAIGTAFLSMAVIGSGIMAERLTSDPALMLLANAAATTAVLYVLIGVFASISGAQFNPAVTLVAVLRGEMRPSAGGGYVAAQIAGACLGAMLAHAMFGQPLVSAYDGARSGPTQWLSEVVAAGGLVLVILLSREKLAERVALYILAAYWFTASTSFANPAMTLARSLTGSFSGIRIADVPGFVVAQLLGAGIAMLLADWLLPRPAGEGG